MLEQQIPSMKTGVLQPAISVIMPVYNSALYLREAIDSILNQSFANFEFLIFNDGSVDESKAIIESYKDSRIKFYDDPVNRGLINRLNVGLDLARGKYIARMDSDDRALPERFSKQYAYLEQHTEIALCGTFFEFIDETGAPATGFNWALCADAKMVKINLLFDGAICHPSVMIRRSVLVDNYKYYDQAYEHAEDFEMWIRMSDKLLLANLPEVLLQYRSNSNQVSGIHNAKQREQKFDLVTQQLARLNIKPSAIELRLHDHMIYPSVIMSADYLPRIKNWTKKLLRANSVNAVYDQAAFEFFLNDLYNKNVVAFQAKLKTLTLKQKVSYLIKKTIGWKSIS